MHGFPKKLVPTLACQQTGELLTVRSVTDHDETHIRAGELVAPSGKTYPIRDGIVHMLDWETLYAEGKEEVVLRDEQAATYDEKLASRHAREVPSTIRALGDTAGKRVIDYGCGTGRITQEIEAYDALLGVDLSLESLRLFNEKLEENSPAGLVLANVTSFKPAARAFDIALTSQVLEHVPGASRRRVFLANIHASLTETGRIVATFYHQSLYRVRSQAPQEGRHPSGIFFHYFTFEEARTEFEQFFEIVRLTGIDVTLPVERRLKLPPRVEGTISRVCESLPLLRRFAHLILVQGRVK